MFVMHALFRIKQWLIYQWKAKTKYYIHSPFVYQFYLNVLEGTQDENLLSIQKLRKHLGREHSLLQLTDLGTGQHVQREISSLEKNVAIPDKYGQVLYRLVHYFKPINIIEIGTSIGISSSYLGLGKTDAKIISLEGDANLIAVAQKNHALIGVKNVELIRGAFKDTLPVVVSRSSTPALFYFDGHHKKDATLKYFTQCLMVADEHSIFVFDDIYWSKEMSEAWDEIKQHPRVSLTIDIYQLGICFFRKEKLAKEHFRLRY